MATRKSHNARPLEPDNIGQLQLNDELRKGNPTPPLQRERDGNGGPSSPLRNEGAASITQHAELCAIMDTRYRPVISPVDIDKG